VLGYLNPEYFAGGALRLDSELAHAVIGQLARRLGLDSAAMAAGIHRVINARMADQIRLVSIRRGYDPREFSLLALGGAGPVHGGALARELGIPEVIVPRAPGVLSAFGLLVARVERDQVMAFRGRAETIAAEALGAAFARLDAACQEKMQQEDVPLAEVRVAHSAELRYVGQSYELEVPLCAPPGPATIRQLMQDFLTLHGRIYGHADPAEPVEFVNLRAVHAYSPPAPDLGTWEGGASLRAARKDARVACFPEIGGVATPVYDRLLLPIDEPLEGPAIVEQPDTTTVIYPGQHGRVDRSGNLILRSLSNGH
jgi:N-methylhydantoinase A